MDNPYNLSGLSDGFARGFQLSLQNRDYNLREKRSQEEAERAIRQEGRADEELRLRREAADRESQVTQQALTLGQLNIDDQKHKQSPEQRARQKLIEDTALAAQRANTKQSEASAALAYSGAAKNKAETTAAQAEIDSYKAIRDAAVLNARIKPLLQKLGNTDLQQAVRATQGLLSGAPVSPQIYEDALTVINQTYDDRIQVGVGEPVDAATVEKYRLPRDSVIVDKKVSGFRVNPKEGTVLLDMVVTTKDPVTGITSSYNSMMSRDRSSSPDDPFLKIRIKDIQDKLDGFEFLGETVNNYRKSTGANNLDELSEFFTNNLQAQLDSILISKGKAPQSGQQLSKQESLYLRGVTDIATDPRFLTEEDRNAAERRLAVGLGITPQGAPSPAPSPNEGKRGMVNGKPAMIYPDGTAEYITE